MRCKQSSQAGNGLMIRHAVTSALSLSVLIFSSASWAQVIVHPTDNVPAIVSSKPAGTTFLFTPGIYRLSQPILPRDNDRFIGQTSCAPPATPCPAIISGGIVIGPLAKFDGSNYAVAKQMQHAPRAVNTKNCDKGWTGCIYPEDLFFDGKPYRHLDSPALPNIGPGEWWFDYTNHVIYFHDDPSGHTVETSVTTNAFGGPANNVTIQYLTVEEFADMYPHGTIGTLQGVNSMTAGANWTVENNDITLNHGYGVRIEFGMQILNNYIHLNGQNGIGGGIGFAAAPMTASTPCGCTIQGNTITDNDYAHFDPGFGSGGIKFGTITGGTIRGNTISHNEGAGIHFDMWGRSWLVDGNTITDNSDADGLEQEIGFGTSTYRNNLVLRNGAQVNEANWTFQIGIRASSGVDAYCNVLEIPAGTGIGGWTISATKREPNAFPPYQSITSTGNSFHHNTVIWDPGAKGPVGFWQNDPANQPDFFASNTPPDYNSYHLSEASADNFIYDNDNSHSNRRKPFASHKGSGADVHSTVDKNNRSGFPVVSITSPSDQSSVTNPTTVTATASDNSGISKVEFYVDWNLQATVKESPYSFDWTNGTTGPHTVAAMAYSKAGIRACYAVTLNEQ
jgi:Bacterial Ig domain/Right handed beta helix region